MLFLGTLATSALLLLICSVLLYVFQLLSQYKLFEKYGEPGWKGLIPFYSTIVESKKIWNVFIGIVLVVIPIVINLYTGTEEAPGFLLTALSIAFFVIRVIYSDKKSKAFGHSFGMMLLLLFLPFVGNLVLGLGDSVYQGNRN